MFNLKKMRTDRNRADKKKTSYLLSYG